MSKFKEWLDKQNYVVIDGAMSTALEQKGLDLNHKLWTAKALIEQPEKIIEVHKEYYDSGANIAITSTYQASFLGFKDAGYSEDEAEDLIRKTVKLANTARELSINSSEKWVAGSIGPYGAYLADGSEYRGDYKVDKQYLKDFHKKRLAILIDEGVDLLAVETIPNFEEVQVLLELLENYPDVVAWLTCTLKDGEHISDGTKLEEVQELLEKHSQIIAYGFNCVAPELVLPALKVLKHKKNKPLIVYPNGGAVYDPTTKEWSSDKNTVEIFSNDALSWFENGCKLIGGCCCTTKKDIEVLAKSLKENNL